MSESSSTDPAAGLIRIGLSSSAAQIPDFLARATKARYSPTTLLEEIVRQESLARAQKSVEHRLQAARIGSLLGGSSLKHLPCETEDYQAATS